MKNYLKNLLKEILEKEDKEKAKILARFFKTGKGEYGEEDKFLGITVPVSRNIAKKYADIDFKDLEKLLENKYHEVRLVALLILVHKYKFSASTASEKNSSARSVLAERKKIVDFYLKHTKYINNWDLVDLSCHYILGDYLYNDKISHKSDLWQGEKILEKLARSKNLWERRIAIVSTFAFIYKGESKWTFKITEMLMKDKHNLIHKACGWMLREVGKRVGEKELLEFLNKHHKEMPRIMIRYAIERLPERKRKEYLKK